MVADGFPNQRLVVLPATAVHGAATRGITRRLLVTDVGCYPDAAQHEITRARGIDRAVVIVCLSGGGWIETRHGKQIVGPGDVVVLPQNEPHRYAAEPGNPWTIWWLHVTGTDAAELLGHDGSAEHLVRRCPQPTRAIGLIDEILTTLERDLRESALRRASGAAWHLLAILSERRPHTYAAEEAVEHAVSHLRQNLAEDLRITDLARQASMSTSHFQALFTRVVGEPVGRFRTSLRMAEARRLLDQSDDPITTIAYAVGYRDPAFFSRQFTKIHGQSPTGYRRHEKG